MKADQRPAQDSSYRTYDEDRLGMRSQLGDRLVHLTCPISETHREMGNVSTVKKYREITFRRFLTHWQSDNFTEILAYIFWHSTWETNASYLTFCLKGNLIFCCLACYLVFYLTCILAADMLSDLTFYLTHMGVSKVVGYPGLWMVYFMENPI